MKREWRFNRQQRVIYDATVPIHVREPTGIDVQIVAILRKNPKLVHAMLSPFELPKLDHPERIHGMLKAILDMAPKSSYADYARYGLARSLLKGRATYYRITWPTRDILIEKILKRWPADVSAYPPNDKEKILVALSQGHRPKLTQAQEADVDAILKDRELDDGERRQKLVEFLLYEFFDIAPADRRRAAEYLEAIASKDFPYRPQALVVLKDLYVAEAYYAKAWARWSILVPKNDLSGRIPRLIDELTSRYDDVPAWYCDPDYVSPDKWQEIKDLVKQRPGRED